VSSDLLSFSAFEQKLELTEKRTHQLRKLKNKESATPKQMWISDLRTEFCFGVADSLFFNLRSWWVRFSVNSSF
jgi:hypothetical protein